MPMVLSAHLYSDSLTTHITITTLLDQHRELSDRIHQFLTFERNDTAQRPARQVEYRTVRHSQNGLSADCATEASAVHVVALAPAGVASAVEVNSAQPITLKGFSLLFPLRLTQRPLISFFGIREPSSSASHHLDDKNVTSDWNESFIPPD
ncbi:MAG: hypothetical protein J0L73_25940 [Verrucomicrobia bacterium]|nr:hypothetical protein [Verrucomicrobiota bacterium]